MDQMEGQRAMRDEMPAVEVKRANMQRPSRVMFGLAAVLFVDIVIVTWLYPEERDVTFWAMLACTFGAFLVWAVWAGLLLRRDRGHAMALTLLSIILAMVVIGALLTTFIHKPQGETGRPAWAEWTVHLLRAFSGAYLLFAFVYMIRASVRSSEQRS